MLLLPCHLEFVGNYGVTTGEGKRVKKTSEVEGYTEVVGGLGEKFIGAEDERFGYRHRDEV